MTALPVPLFIEQGATFAMGFTWCRESDPPTVPPTAGAPYDLTDAVVRMQIRKTYKSPPILDLTTGVGETRLVIDDPSTSGHVSLKLTATDTGLLTADAIYDLEIQLPNGDVRRILEGSVTVDLNVTRAFP